MLQKSNLTRSTLSKNSSSVLRESKLSANSQARATAEAARRARAADVFVCGASPTADRKLLMPDCADCYSPTANGKRTASYEFRQLQTA